MRVGVLGAGIMGVSVALFLARAGAEVVLIDEAPAPLRGASRWNEGKIHLGFLYAADPTLKTARRVISGGLTFAPLMCELVGGGLPKVTTTDDLYLVHRDSVVPVEAAAAYYWHVAELLRQHPQSGDYLVDVSRATIRELSRDELAAVANPSAIAAGFSCPERSVCTQSLGDLLVDALKAEPRIELRLGVRVVSVAPKDSDSGPWRVDYDFGGEVGSEEFDYTVNALWQGRIGVDKTAGMAPSPGWSHRYRVSAFVRTKHAFIEKPSAVVATGPFGDVKNYNGRDFYISWYPAGLLAEGDELLPPRVDPTALDAQLIRLSIEQGLSPILPWIGTIFADAERTRIEGGYVFAVGKGGLHDPCATVHRRDRFGIARRGRYISVDTGKYSSAPLLAKRIAEFIQN